MSCEGEHVPKESFDWSPTKRKIFSAAASVFNPLGLVNPVTTRMKMFLQQLWKEGHE